MEGWAPEIKSDFWKITHGECAANCPDKGPLFPRRAANGPVFPPPSVALPLGVMVWRAVFVAVTQRPSVGRHASTGTWGTVLWCTVVVSVITNCALFALSSEQLASWTPFLYRDATQDDVDAGRLETIT